MPAVATIPISPDPGATGSSSSLNTFTYSAMLNFAVFAALSRVLIDPPMEPSVEPMMSFSTIS